MNVNSRNQPAPRKKWTVLCYMDGKNNLSKMVERSLKSLDKIGSDDNVNLVAEVGLDWMDTVRRGQLTGQGISSLQSVGPRDMGNASTVQEFLEWGMKNYPAEHYAVILSDHGGGFRGVLNDEEYGSVVEPEDLARAMEGAQRRSGANIDVLAFDACLMAQAEVGWALRNSAKYMVASQEVEAGFQLPIPGMNGGMPLRHVMSGLKSAHGDLNGEELSRLFVFEAGRQLGRASFTPTQSAVDLGRMDTVRNSCEGLAAQLLQAMQSDPSVKDRLRSVIGKTQGYAELAGGIKPYGDYRDLGDFGRRVEREFKELPRVQAAAQGLQVALAGATLAESHSVSSSGVSMFGSTGMSVYLPTDLGRDMGADRPNWGYHDTDFARGSQWMTMLASISQPASGLSLPSGNGMILKLARNLGRLELVPMVMMGSAMVGPLGTVTAVLAGVDSVYRVKGGLQLMGQAVENFGVKGTGSALARGLVDTASGVMMGAAAVSMLTGAHSLAFMLGAGALGLDLVAAGVRGGAALVRKAVDATRSVDDKVAATRKSDFAPTVGPRPVAPAASAPLGTASVSGPVFDFLGLPSLSAGGPVPAAA